MPMETSKWENFTQADYDALFAKLASGEIAPKKDDAAESPVDLGCANVNVTFIEQ